jgi:hypothetical protein
MIAVEVEELEQSSKAQRCSSELADLPGTRPEHDGNRLVRVTMFCAFAQTDCANKCKRNPEIP